MTRPGTGRFAQPSQRQLTHTNASERPSDCAADIRMVGVNNDDVITIAVSGVPTPGKYRGATS